MKILVPILLFFAFTNKCHSQTALGDFFEIYWGGLSDHLFKLNSKNRTDTSKWTIENKYKNSILGNSTYVVVATTFYNSKDFEISIGQTKGIITN
jgi:hypothetical protein